MNTKREWALYKDAMKIADAAMKASYGGDWQPSAWQDPIMYDSLWTKWAVLVSDARKRLEIDNSEPCISFTPGDVRGIIAAFNGLLYCVELKYRQLQEPTEVALEDALAVRSLLEAAVLRASTGAAGKASTTAAAEEKASGSPLASQTAPRSA